MYWLGMIRSSLTYIRLLTEMLRSSRKSGANCATREGSRVSWLHTSDASNETLPDDNLNMKSCPYLL